jgi:hypothetical protein
MVNVSRMTLDYRLVFSGAPLDRKLGARVADVVLRTFAPTGN